jgi:purine-binding chemotaxis protein CheW
MLSSGEPTTRKNMLPLEVLSYRLGDQIHAIPLLQIEKVVQAVAITRLPDPPRDIKGVIDVQGRIVPVIDTHAKAGLDSREIGLDDRLVLGRSQGRMIALQVDEVLGVQIMSPDQLIRSGDFLPSMEGLEGVIKGPDGLILVHDLDGLLQVDLDDLELPSRIL